MQALSFLIFGLTFRCKRRSRQDDRQFFGGGGGGGGGAGPARNKRMRGEFEPYRRMDGPRGGRFGGRGRDSFPNGGHDEPGYDDSYAPAFKSPGFSGPSFYNNKKSYDYMRDYAPMRQAPPHPMPPYGPPPPGYFEPPPASYTNYDRPRGDYMSGSDYNAQSSSSRPRSDSKRSYERDVDDFLRRTTYGVSKYRERDERDREREHRDRDRERDRERDRDRHRHRDRR